jgi:hypothetical protein
MGLTCSKNREKRNEYKILVGKPERKGPLGRPRHKWREIIKINPRLNRTGWYGLG